MAVMIREMQIKPQKGITINLSECLLSKKQNLTNVGDDVEQRETSCTSGGNISWYSHCANSMEVPQKIKNSPTLRSSNSTSHCVKEMKTLT